MPPGVGKAGDTGTPVISQAPIKIEEPKTTEINKKPAQDPNQEPPKQDPKTAEKNTEAAKQLAHDAKNLDTARVQILKDQLAEKLPEKKAPIDDLHKNSDTSKTLKDQLAEQITKGPNGPHILMDNAPVQAGPTEQATGGSKKAKNQDQDLLFELKYSDEKNRFQKVKEEFQKLTPSEAKQMLGKIKTSNPKDPVSKEFHAKFKKAEADQLKDVLVARFNPDALVPKNSKQSQKASSAESNSRKSDLNVSGTIQRTNLQNQLKPKTSAEIVKVIADSKQPFSKPGEELTWKEKQAMDGFLGKTNSEEFKKILQDSKNWSLDAQINLYSVVGDNDKLADRMVKEFKGNDLVEVAGRTLQFYKGSNNFRAAIIDHADLSEMPGLINSQLDFDKEIMRNRRGREIIDSVDKRSKENLMTSVLSTIRSNQSPSLLEGENFFRAYDSLSEPDRIAFFGNMQNRGILTPQVFQGIERMAKDQKFIEERLRQIHQKMQLEAIRNFK